MDEGSVGFKRAGGVSPRAIRATLRAMLKSSLLLAFALSFGSGACGEPAAAESSTAGEESTETSDTHARRTFETHGTIRGVDRERGTVTIFHDDVPGYMPSMTMPFWVSEPSQLEGLDDGARVWVRFERRDEGRHYILAIRTVD